MQQQPRTPTVEQTNQSPTPIQIQDVMDIYVPSSQEKKKVVMMYMFVGIILMMFKKQATVFEYYHLKQAIGWWIVFLVMLVVGVVFLFLPYVRYVVLIPLLALVIVCFVFVKQARDGKYVAGEDTSPMALFGGVGIWVLGLFEMNISVPSSNQITQTTDMPDSSSQVPDSSI